jgi:ribosome biogenesis GTPase A
MYALIFLQQTAPESLSNRFKSQQLSLVNIEKSDNDEFTDRQIQTILEEVAKSRNFILGGGIPNIDLAADTILKDLRDGRLGKFTFDSLP